jgi:hypothetical protein
MKLKEMSDTNLIKKWNIVGGEANLKKTWAKTMTNILCSMWSTMTIG